ncbi:transketolase [Pelagibius litoralis]|uniref:Transketolase n=1 Tax=Pelagibius litoralis TaxID=374515 RepID=A0A967F099_9PROT|nr:transketolase [Pelagibius litoralis]NIA70639.1 transketolase [Pelagibius litoralis]
MPSREVRNVSKDELKEKGRMVRRAVLRMTDICGSGHYGSAYSMTELVNVLYYQLMHTRPDDPGWADRDRFTMGKGHAAIGLFPVLADLGFFPEEELEGYTKLGSPLGDHPVMNKVKGVDFSSGSIGHNLSVSVGMASALRRRGSPARVICMMGDGEQNEGQVWEAAQAAAHWGLDNLVGIVDFNDAGSDGFSQETMRSEPLKEKWEAFGWEVLVLEDGHDLDACFSALNHALNAPSGKPTLVLAYTIAGKGVSFMEGGWQFHIGFLGPKDLDKAYAEVAAGDIG